MDQRKLEYIVVGGWSPLLRGGNPQFKHRGTRDVDLLFGTSRDELATAAKLLLGAGYRRSAKHAFQILKPLNIGPSQLVGHIDLLFPFGEADDSDLFQDVLDLGIPTNDETEHVESIALASAAVLFAETLWSLVPIKGVTPGGEEKCIDIRLVNEAGCIFTKCVSLASKKRSGDSFDIYYFLSGPNGPAIATEIKSLAENGWRGFDTQLGSLRNFLKKHPDRFNDNVAKHSGVEGEYASFVQGMLF